jgi:hypothetical protein
VVGGPLPELPRDILNGTLMKQDRAGAAGREGGLLDRRRRAVQGADRRWRPSSWRVCRQRASNDPTRRRPWRCSRVLSGVGWAASDANGRFIFNRVPVGEYTCMARGPDGAEAKTELAVPGGALDLTLGSACGRKAGKAAGAKS